MAQLTADISRKYKLDPHSNADQPVDAAVAIFAGSMVGLNPSTNYARQLVGGDQFLGFADALANNIVNPLYPNVTGANGLFIGQAGAVNCECRSVGVLVVPLSAVAGATGVANETAPVYASDGNTLTLAVQTNTVTVTGSPTGGTFVLTSNGTSGSAIAYNATASAFQTGLPANVAPLVSGVSGSAGGPFTITFNPGVTPSTITLGTNSLTGGTSPSVSVGAAAAASGYSKVGTIRSFLYGQLEIKFSAAGEKVS